MNLTMIVILAIVIIVVSILMAFGKAVGAGGNVKDFFPEQKKKDDGPVAKEEPKPKEDKTA